MCHSSVKSAEWNLSPVETAAVLDRLYQDLLILAGFGESLETAMERAIRRVPISKGSMQTERDNCLFPRFGIGRVLLAGLAGRHRVSVPALSQHDFDKVISSLHYCTLRHEPLELC